MTHCKEYFAGEAYWTKGTQPDIAAPNTMRMDKEVLESWGMMWGFMLVDLFLINLRSMLQG